MRIYTEEVALPRGDLRLEALKTAFPRLPHPVRFVVTKTGPSRCWCEVDCVSDLADCGAPYRSIFEFAPRRAENTGAFTAVLLIPTGIGAEIGGHCGDGNAAARLLAAACDTLITHPNVVNAADMNEMTDNTLYVEGSILTRFLMGTIGLQRCRSNRVLILMDRHEDAALNAAAVNVVGTARACLGIDCDVLQMDGVTQCASGYSRRGKASGEIRHAERLLEVVAAHRQHYDAIGLTTHVDVPLQMEEAYYTTPGVVNPWGGIEAMLTHTVASLFDLPCAHSPMAVTLAGTNRVFEAVGVVDPRKAADVYSRTYLYSILKGLFRAPRIVYGTGLTVADVSCLVIPDGCVGLPTLAALEQGVPVIAVRENRNLMRNRLEDLPFRPGRLFVVDNYLEAVGVMTAIRAGVTPAAVRRPLRPTVVLTQLPRGNRRPTTRRRRHGAGTE